MFSVGAGFGLLALAIYFLFLTESGWLRIIGGLYVSFFFVVSVIAAFQSTEPLMHLIVPGIIALLMVYANSIRAKWKDWP
jgi:hypothetical protein